MRSNDTYVCINELGYHWFWEWLVACTNASVLSIRSLRTNFNKICINTQIFFSRICMRQEHVGTCNTLGQTRSVFHKQCWILFLRILSQNCQNDLEGHGQWAPIFNNSWKYRMMHILWFQLKSVSSYHVDKVVYGQTDGKTDGTTISLLAWKSKGKNNIFAHHFVEVFLCWISPLCVNSTAATSQCCWYECDWGIVVTDQRPY